MNSLKKALPFLCILFCSALSAQENEQAILNSFLENFSKQIRTKEHQQVYLVTDRSVFKAGDPVWFKAFLLNTISGKAALKPGLLFIDLVDERDSVINTVILDQSDKQLNSKIQLPASVAPGYYWLRAYTPDMSGENPEGICVVPLYIFNRVNDLNNSRLKKNPDNKPELSFYPEGNSIITGASSLVGLGIVDKNGTPVSIEGVIKDNKDSVVARFATNEYGMAKFSFEPSGYRKYVASINWQGKEITYPVPAFDFFKGQVAITRQQPGYKLRILLGDSIYRKETVTYIVGIAKDSIVFASTGKGQYELLVDETKLPGGINTFYLFDKKFNLLSERSIYVHAGRPQVKIIADRDKYSSREKVSLAVSVSNDQQQPLSSLVTVSVADSLLEPQANTAFAASLQPAADNSLLARNENFSEESTDLLMLTRSNTWASLNSPADESITNPDSLLFINGTVFNEKQQPSGDKIVTIFANSSRPVLFSDTTDTKGRFHIAPGPYADSTEFVMEVKGLDGKRLVDYYIRPDRFAYPKINTPLYLKRRLSVQIQKINRYFYSNEDLGQGEGKTLSPVTVKSDIKQVSYDESKRVSKSSVVIPPENINERYSVSNSILMVGGLQILHGWLVMLGPSELMSEIGPQSEPILIIDDAQVPSTGGILRYIDAINPRSIDFIEVLKGPEAALYGVSGGNGAIVIHTLAGGRKEKGGAKGLTFFNAKGISVSVAFPNLLYDKKNNKNVPVLDNRSTLFWSGNYLTNRAGDAGLTFYTNDIHTSFRITVTGITRNGDIVYKTMTIQNK